MEINKLSPVCSSRRDSLLAEARLQPAVAAVSETEAILKLNFAPQLYTLTIL